MFTERDLKDEIEAYAKSTMVPETMEARVRLGYEKILLQRGKSFRVRQGLVSGGLSLAVVGGAVISGYASPRAARALRHIPILGGVADALFAGANPGVEHAVKHGFNIPINKSIIHGGITLTATNAYFGPNQLWIGLTQTFAKNLDVHPRIRLAKMELDVDGKEISPVQSEFRPVANGSFVGDIGTYKLPKGLPNTITATVRIHKMGNIVSNDWTITMQLSRSTSEAATKTYGVDAAASHDGTSWTITKVTQTPATAYLKGQITIPGRVAPNQWMIASPNSPSTVLFNVPQAMKLIRSTATSSTWSFSTSVSRTSALGSFVTLEPVFTSMDINVPIPKASTSFDMKPYVFFPSTSEQLRVTGMDVSKSAIRVTYTTAGAQYLKPNFYHLALEYAKKGSDMLGGLAFPTTHRIINRQQHEAEIVFSRPADMTTSWLTYHGATHSVGPKKDGATTMKTIVTKATGLRVNVPLK